MIALPNLIDSTVVGYVSPTFICLLSRASLSRPISGGYRLGAESILQWAKGPEVFLHIRTAGTRLV